MDLSNVLSQNERGQNGRRAREEEGEGEMRVHRVAAERVETKCTGIYTYIYIYMHVCVCVYPGVRETPKEARKRKRERKRAG